MTKKADVVIVGGGIIGISAAYYLLKDGRDVTILEKGKVGDGSSYGNAGWIVPSYSVPIASPGALSHGLKWLLDRSSPFYIKPRPSLDLLRWLWQFRAASNEETMRRGIPVLRDMSRLSLSLFDDLVESERLNCHYRRRGLLTVFRSRAELRAGEEEALLLQEYGIPVQMLSPAEVQDMAPLVRPGVVGGKFSPEDAHIDPAEFLFAMADRVQAMGAETVTGAEVRGFRAEGGRITAVETGAGEFEPEQVVLAAGAWSPVVAGRLGVRIPVQAAKGYSVTVERPDGFPELPLMLGESKVAVTPLEGTLRFAGTLELAGLDLFVNQRRVDAILQAVRTYLALEPLRLPTVEVWRGLRPCTPDGLPIVGRAPTLENLTLATGHCMLGLSLGPITGLLVSQIVGGKRPELPLEPLRPDRF